MIRLARVYGALAGAFVLGMPLSEVISWHRAIAKERAELAALKSLSRALDRAEPIMRRTLAPRKSR
jgi:hypothetical protein